MGVLVLLPIIMIGLAAYTQRGLTEMRESQLVNERAQAHYLAFAALQKAGRAVLDNPTYRGVNTYVQAQGGHYSYTVEGSEIHAELGSSLRITATGTFTESVRGQTRKELSVIVRRRLGRSVLDYAMAAGARVTLNGGAQVGDPSNTDNVVYAHTTDPLLEDQAIYGQGSTWIYGRGEVATTVPQISLPNMDPGPVDYGVKPLDFPTYDIDAFRTKAQNNTKNPQYPGGAYFSGNTVFENETIKGVVFVEGGTVDIKGTVDIQGAIIHIGPETFTVNADVTMRSDMDPVTGAPYVGIVKLGGGLLKFSAAKTADIEGFVLSDGQIIFDSDGVVRGGLISPENVELGGNCTVYFHHVDAAQLAGEITVPGEWYAEVVAWAEPSSR